MSENQHVSEPFRSILNQFAHLSAENPEHRLAQLSPEEQAEANAYYDEMNANASDEPPCPICGDSACDGECDHGDDPLHDGAAYDDDNLSDVEADAMTLASAGMGTDEDYEHNLYDETPLGDYYGGE